MQPWLAAFPLWVSGAALGGSTLWWALPTPPYTHLFLIHIHDIRLLQAHAYDLFLELSLLLQSQHGLVSCKKEQGAGEDASRSRWEAREG